MLFVEALNDIEKYLDETMVKYIEDNLKDPSKKDRFMTAMKRYARLAERESDPMQALYYEYRMLLPETQARILAREFYQKNIRSGTGTDTVTTDEGEQFFIADSVGYGNAHSNIGMFANLTAMDKTPEAVAEIEDILNKLFNSPYLTTRDKYVLIVRLMFGTGPGLRFKPGSERSGMDIEEFLGDNTPPEYSTIMDQIDKLVKFGVPAADIKPTQILQGEVKRSESGTTIASVPPLVDFKYVNQTAEPAIKKAIQNLIGADSVEDLFKFMLESKGDKPHIVNAIMDYISGKAVKLSDLIHAIVVAVDLNIKKKTRLSKSKLFTGSVKTIATKYKELAKSKDEKDIFKVQDLFMAPALDNMDPRL